MRLSPPGFGAPVPPGFLTTAQGYRDWLTDELEELGVPVDLVGHDWGGAHVVNVAMTRPDLLRSWCTDSVGLFDLDYTWHALARTWQTAWVGEKAVAELTVPAARQRAASLASIGVPADIASARAPGCADVSGPAVLALYRTPRNNPQWPTSAATCPPQRSAPAWSCSPRTTLPLAPKRCAGVPRASWRDSRDPARPRSLVDAADPDLAAGLLCRFWSSLRS